MQQKLIEYSRDDIYNMDETDLFYKPFPSKTVCKSVREGYKILKDRVSIGSCSNFYGTHIMKPLIIDKPENPRCFCNWKQRSINYTLSKRAWITREIFIKWLLDINDEMKLNKRKILLLIDNCSAHNINNQYSNIEIMFFLKNTTGILQLMNKKIIRNFKLFFNKYNLSNVLDQVEKKR
ncbi:Tigger transposable element-derived protein 6 [Cucumispora dikerogammari]|nr:Tigger transposable element-derived protein 6 [Cucumispora dikerogammari]